jgi:hypothetical protein
VQTLTTKLDALPSSGPEWTQPATHFVDTLPTYTPMTLAMVLLVIFLLGALALILWVQLKRQHHQKDMIAAVAVPFEAFSQVVQQHAATTEILGRRIEDMSNQMAIVGENLAHLSNTLTTAVEQISSFQIRSTVIQSAPQSQHGRQQHG